MHPTALLEVLCCLAGPATHSHTFLISLLPPSVLQEHAAGRTSLWVLKEDVHRGKGVVVVTPAQLLTRALERAPGNSWDWRSLVSGGSWAGWQRLLQVRAARHGWRGAVAHVWGTWNGAMNQLWRSVRSSASWRSWRGPGAPTRHVLAQQFLGEQYLVGGRPFYIR